MISFLFPAVLLLMFCAILLLKERRTLIKRLSPVLLGALVVLAVLFHYRFFAFHGNGQNFHNLEVYHYYLGAKYFPELGYAGLYEASVVADSQDDPYFKLDLPVRSLENYQLVSRQDILNRKPSIEARFTPSRWQQFRKDLAVFRSTAPTSWSAQFGYRDHGYNASPFLTWILSEVLSQPWISSEAFIKICGWLDPVLILAAAAVIGCLLGLEAALVFLFFTAINPLNDYTMIGGAYLRYLSYCAAALGIAFWRRRIAFLSGVFLGWASLMRVFPLLFIPGFWGESFSMRKETRRPLIGLFFLLGALVSGVNGYFLTAQSAHPESGTVWQSFRRQIKLHASEMTPNKVGVKFLFSFSDSRNVKQILSTWPSGERLSWAAESQKTFSRRAGYYKICAGVLCLAAILSAFRLGAGYGFLAGLLLVFTLLDLSHYYYCFLSLIPLALGEKKKAVIFLSFGFTLMYLVQSIPAIGGITDRRFFVLSLLVMVQLLGLCLIGVWERLRPASQD